MRRRYSRFLPWIVLAAAGAACGGPQEPGGPGDDCFRDDECEPGLVCVSLDQTSNRVCSSDVSGLVSTVEGPVADAGEVPAEGGAGNTPAAGGAPGVGVGGAPAVTPPTAGAPAMTGAGGAI